MMASAHENDVYNVSAENHGDEDMFSQLARMRGMDFSTCDAFLRCEGETIPVHKAVLAAGSPVFAEIFSTHGVGRGIIIVCPDFSLSAMRILVDFIYSGTKSIEPYVVLPEVAELAEILKICGLVDNDGHGLAKLNMYLLRSYDKPVSGTASDDVNVVGAGEPSAQEPAPSDAAVERERPIPHRRSRNIVNVPRGIPTSFPRHCTYPQIRRGVPSRISSNGRAMRLRVPAFRTRSPQLANADVVDYIDRRRRALPPLSRPVVWRGWSLSIGNDGRPDLQPLAETPSSPTSSSTPYNMGEASEVFTDSNMADSSSHQSDALPSEVKIFGQETDITTADGNAEQPTALQFQAVSDIPASYGNDGGTKSAVQHAEPHHVPQRSNSSPAAVVEEPSTSIVQLVRGTSMGPFWSLLSNCILNNPASVPMPMPNYEGSSAGHISPYRYYATTADEPNSFRQVRTLPGLGLICPCNGCIGRRRLRKYNNRE